MGISPLMLWHLHGRPADETSHHIHVSPTSLDGQMGLPVPATWAPLRKFSILSICLVLKDIICSLVALPKVAEGHRPTHRAFQPNLETQTSFPRCPLSAPSSTKLIPWGPSCDGKSTPQPQDAVITPKPPWSLVRKARPRRGTRSWLGDEASGRARKVESSSGCCLFGFAESSRPA